MSKNRKKNANEERSVVFSTSPETLGDLFQDIHINESHPSPGENSVRVHLEKKGRAGKTVSIIKGLNRPEEELKSLLKELKTKCGSGGSLQADGSLLIQGNDRDKIIEILTQHGYKDVKKSGG
jgi:translation initiation factor 1